MYKIIRQFKQSIWLYPAIYSFFSFFGALVVIYFDRGNVVKLPDFLPSLIFTQVDLAQNILTVIAGSLITMTTFTFSTTLVVLTTYSSQFSPRTVENFLLAPKTMKTLGIFTGGFIYAITTLLFMRKSFGDQGILAATLGIVYSIFCLIVFIQFIQHVGNYIQTNNLIQRLQTTCQEHIQEYLDLIQKGNVVQKAPLFPQEEKMEVFAGDYGYLQWVDLNGITNCAQSFECNIIMETSVGHYVDKTQSMFQLRFAQPPKETVQEIAPKIQEQTIIAHNRSEDQDFLYTIQKISEIGTRALSPGINDPNTAVHCIQTIGILLQDLSKLPKGYFTLETKPETQEDGQDYNVYIPILSFDEILFDAYQQMVFYGREDFSTIEALFSALGRLIRTADPKSLEDIREFWGYVWDKMDPGLKLGLDGKRLQQLKEKYY